MAILSSGVKYYERTIVSALCKIGTSGRAYPSLRTRPDAGVDYSRSTSSGIRLGVKAQVGTEKLDTLVVSFLDHPLLVSRGLLVVVGAIASRQGYWSAVAWV